LRYKKGEKRGKRRSFVGKREGGGVRQVKKRERKEKLRKNAESGEKNAEFCAFGG